MLCFLRTVHFVLILYCTLYICHPTSDLMLPSMEVMLSPSTVNRTINVEITDDTDFEGVESLKLELNFTRGETHRLNLTNPTTLVTIFDNDGKFKCITYIIH